MGHTVNGFVPYLPLLWKTVSAVFWTEGFHCPGACVGNMAHVINLIAQSSSPQPESHFNCFPTITPFYSSVKPQGLHRLNECTYTHVHTFSLRGDRVNGNLLNEEEEMTVEEYSTCFPFHGKKWKRIVWFGYFPKGALLSSQDIPSPSCWSLMLSSM